MVARSTWIDSGCPAGAVAALFDWRGDGDANPLGGSVTLNGFAEDCVDGELAMDFDGEQLTGWFLSKHSNQTE